MKKILLFGAGKSATVLIDYLVAGISVNNWEITVADASLELVLSKTKSAPGSIAVRADVTNKEQRATLISAADIVISMMPPALHFLIAKDCVEFTKNLLTASYIDENIKALASSIKDKKILFLCEMGLDPGIDHMSAMKLFDEIKLQGGEITSFKSHCGGLVAPDSDDNPWHYKISWNPRNVVLAGKAGADYLQDSKPIHQDYIHLFQQAGKVLFDAIGELAFYPNRDSLSYIPVYGLDNATTFVRTTLRFPEFCNGWDAIVQAGLTKETDAIETGMMSFKQWSSSINQFVTDTNKELLSFLGMFDEAKIPGHLKNSADVVQYLLETKLVMQPADKDMILMLHEIEYSLYGTPRKIESSLVVKGLDSIRTAMAKTVGLPLGIASKFILDGTIQLTGTHIPTKKEIYIPVLKELETYGVAFIEKHFE